MINLAPEPQRKVTVDKHELFLQNDFHLPLGRKR